jgi:hypothetical protein
MQPGVELVGVAERAQVTPGVDERVLDGVLGAVRVADDEPGDRVGPANRCGDEGGDGVPVSGASPQDDLSIHRT